MENPQEEAPVQQERFNLLKELGWYGTSLVLPSASLSFYRRAVERSLASAVVFFMAFMAVISLVSTLGVTSKMVLVGEDIRKAFASGAVPEIYITNGTAQVQGKQPAILFDRENTLVAIDTTGVLKDIDRVRYTSGILLTAKDLVILNNTQYQRVSLSQVLQVLNQSTLKINAETVSNAWQAFTAGFGLIVFIGFAFWNMVVRFLYLAALALFVLAIIGTSGISVPYHVILRVGIYAFVPVVFLIYVIDRIGFSFLLLQTLLLLGAWSIGLYAALVRGGWDILGPDRRLREWRALVGVPFMIVMVVDVLTSPRNGGWIDLFAWIVTLIALIIAGWLSKPSLDELGLPPVKEPPPVVESADPPQPMEAPQPPPADGGTASG
jgi:hypothetical protein